MAKRLTTEDHLALLRQLRTAPPADAKATLDSLEQLLSHPKLHGLVLKGAVELALTLGAPARERLSFLLVTRARELAPIKGVDPPTPRDPGCLGKRATLAALIEWDTDAPDFYVEAAAWVQAEKIQGGSIDTAGECRGLSAIGVCRTRPPNAILLLIDLLANTDTATRQYAAMALGMWRGPEALPVLRLKAHTGDLVADVMGEVFNALLRHEPREQIPFVAGFLNHPDLSLIEQAAMALAQTHDPSVLPLLRQTFDRYQHHPIHSSLLMSAAMLRIEASFAWLLELVAKPSLASKALDALSIYRSDERAIERISAVAAKHRETAALFRDIFR